jgi:hypothetical protein
MRKVDEYRRNAVVTVDLANKAATTFDKSWLLSLADRWLDLAYRAHRVTKPPTHQLGDHPLVEKTLGHDQIDEE